MSPEPRLPAPAPLAGALPDPERSPPLRLYRIHREPDPLRPPHRAPRARFDREDAPVTYANGSLPGAFGEVYGDRRRIPAADSGRRASALIAPARRASS